MQNKIDRRFCRWLSLLMNFVLLYFLLVSFSTDAFGLTRTENSWRYQDGKPIEQNNLKTGDHINDAEVSVNKAAVLNKGIDVSNWQEGPSSKYIDWAKVKASKKVEFAIIRGGWWTDESKNDDNEWEYNASECEKHKIPYGMYIYSYAESDSEALSEARHALRLAKGHNLSYPIYIDLEDDCIPKKNAARYAQIFCQEIERHGYTSGIYASLTWWNNYLNSSSLDGYEHWVAQWYSSCQYKKSYGLWQYTSDGSISGIKGRVDLDYNYYKREGFTRCAGSDRYATNIKTASTLLRMYLEKGKLGPHGRFKSAVIASGQNYPDALSGDYLAILNSGPMLLTCSSMDETVLRYVRNNLEPGATIYLLGGSSVVSNNLYKWLVNYKYKVKRLYGADRYATNLSILKNCPKTDDLLVCYGQNYPDSLSASCVNIPIMLINNNISSAQLTFLKSNHYKNIYVIGGEGVISKANYNKLKSYCDNIERLSGADRYATSKAVADKFFAGTRTNVVLTYGGNFPDGLSGGPLAEIVNGPILLVNNTFYSYSRKYIRLHGGTEVRPIVLGGTGIMPNSLVTRVTN